LDGRGERPVKRPLSRGWNERRAVRQRLHLHTEPAECVAGVHRSDSGTVYLWFPRNWSGNNFVHSAARAENRLATGLSQSVSGGERKKAGMPPAFCISVTCLC